MYVFDVDSVNFLSVNEVFIGLRVYEGRVNKMDLREIRPSGEIATFKIEPLSDSKDHKSDNL
jgi:hypothetical protein